jgi:RHS repeat-associated protein
MGSETASYGFTGEEQDVSGVVFLRARYYSVATGRFLTQDIWQGDYTRPMSLNKWLYVYANPTTYTDSSGLFPSCDEYERADLTQWLIDEMNTNRKSWVASVMRYYIRRWNETKHVDDPIIGGGDQSSLAVGFFIFADLLQGNGVLDFIIKIHQLIGENVRISENWYAFDVPGNIHYGFLGSDVGISKKLLFCGGDFATNHRWCSGSDSPEDKQAIEVGIALQRNTQGREVDENTLRIILTAYGLPKGTPSAPPLDSPVWQYMWPYRVGTFDDGSSGIIFKHRLW